MAARSPEKRGRTLPAALLMAGSWYVYEQTGPILLASHIAPVPAAATAIGILSALTVTADVLWFIGERADLAKAKTPTGLKGSAGFIKSLREIKHDLEHRGWGPYWGCFKGKEVIAPYASNALTLGPAGVGKGVSVVQVTALTIHESKVFIDFKGELACCLAGALRRRGERVRILNLGDLWTDILGPSDSYNPLVLIADDFWETGGLCDVSDLTEELCLQLYPDPRGGSGNDDNGYFRSGSRTFIGFTVILVVLIKGYDGTLGDVAELLNDRQALLRHALWVCGRLEQKSKDGGKPATAAMPIYESPWVDKHEPEDVENFILWFRGVASGIADLLETEESRTADSFITGAQQSLARYNRTTRAHKKTRCTSFRFSELKEGDRPTSAFIVADASRIKAQGPVIGTIIWCLLQELKRHENKKRPVYIEWDEATNFRIDPEELGSLLTWGRSYGIRLHLYLQSLSAFVRVYGKEILNTLLSETEIKQILPGQREPDTLALIERILGEQSLVAQSHRGQKGLGASGVDGFDLREEGRALMNADEARRSKKGILIIGQNKPVPIDLPTIAEISPFRDQIDINPFHGEPFRRPIRLRIKRRDGPFLMRFRSLFRRSAP